MRAISSSGELRRPQLRPVRPPEAPAEAGVGVAGPGARPSAGLPRAVDILVSAAALLLLTPVFALVAVAVRVGSPGPVLYRQVRVGQDRRLAGRRAGGGARGSGDRRRRDRRRHPAAGRPFEIVKFRSMVVDAEAQGPRWSSPGDARVTAVGRVLRVTRLDETPQFWNVLRGEMSLVGPRPERPYFVTRLAGEIPRYTERLAVRPGITGLAQVELDYDSSVDDVRRKVDADLEWLERRSLRGDVRILLATFRVVLTGKGAC